MKQNKKKIKIAFFQCSFVYSGGGERIALEGVLGLRKKGYTVDLYAPAIDWQNCFPDLLKLTKPKKIIPQLPEWFPLNDGFNMLFASLFAPFVAYKFKDYDIFLGENQPGAWFAFVYARLFKRPYVIYLNQPNRLLHPRAIDVKTGWFVNNNFVFLERVVKFIKPFISILDNASIRNANFMTVNGKYIGDIISQIYAKEYIECPAGCDPFPRAALHFTKNANYNNGNLKVNGFTLKKPYILLTNRHYPQKRFDYAIEAFPTILKKYPDIHLYITGAFTKATDSWRTLAEELHVSQRIVWLNEVKNSDMGKLYEHASVYLYTSPEEDYGMGVVEAEELGVPVIAWNHGGPTVTIQDGVTGFLVRPYDIAEFADKILWVLDNPEKRLQMGKRAHEYVHKNFTWKRHVDILEETILKAIDGEKL